MTSSTLLSSKSTISNWSVGSLGLPFSIAHCSPQVTEYNLGELPALVYYRHTIPILYEGQLEAEDDLLEWLIQNRNSGDEEDVIEDVQFKSLEAMVAAVENIAVLFCEYPQLILQKIRFTRDTTFSRQPKVDKDQRDSGEFGDD